MSEFGVGAPEKSAATALLRTFIEAIFDSVILTDRQLRVFASNKAAKLMLPLLQDGAMLPIALRAPDILDAAARVAQGGAAEEINWRERVPQLRIVEGQIAPLASGDDMFISIVLRDKSEAERVDRMRSDFVANASHELRTPLASMLGFVETLQGPARDDAQARTRFLDIMREQGRRMARLLDDLLQLSRIEQVEHVQPANSIDLVGIVRHVADTLASSAQQAGVALQIDAPDKLMIRGERDELIRVVENLVENAIKYGVADGADSPRIDISLRHEAGRAILAVRDYGPGIAQQHLPRLTERFYRVDAGQSRAKGGTGLGLAIVKHIVSRHRGELKVSSPPGSGVEFAIILPAI